MSARTSEPQLAHLASGRWCLIESDPGMFTELVANLGVKDVQVEELYSMDTDSTDRIQPIYGLIFLSQYREERRPPTENDEDEQVYFSNQVIDNACATQAILNILLNTDLDLGNDLSYFREFTKDFTSPLKGLAMTNYERFRDVHNAFSRPAEMENMEIPASKKKSIHTEEDQAYHFIAYVPKNGKVWELDGLQRRPVAVGNIDSSWMDVAMPAIQKRIQKYSQEEIRFNLMAICRDQRLNIIDNLRNKLAQYKSLDARPIDLGKWERDIGKVEATATTTTSDSLSAEIKSLLMDLNDEADKLQRYKLENIRRKHDLVPFVQQFIRILYSHGRLVV